MAGYVEFLKAQVLKDAVVHHTTLPARPRRLAPPPRNFPPAVADILQAGRGVPSLYSHQAEGIGKALDGENVVVATPTASGKTLVYNVPVITALLEDPDAHALYIFPLKALEQDQYDELQTLLQRLGRGLSVDIYDGRYPGAPAPADSRRAAERTHYHAGHAARRAAGFPRGVGGVLCAAALRGDRRVAHLQRRVRHPRAAPAAATEPGVRRLRQPTGAYMTSSATIGNPEFLAGAAGEPAVSHRFRKRRPPPRHGT